MATAGRRGKYQVWQREDADDTNSSLLISSAPPRTSDPQIKKPSRCIGFGPFFLLLLGACLAFLLGICLGYYVRESQKFDDGLAACGTTRSDRFHPEKLASIHENVMYFMSGQKIREFVREHQEGDGGSSSAGSLEQRLERRVRQRLEELGMDSVGVEEYRVLTTVPHPSRPSALELLDSSGSPVSTFQLGSGQQLSRASPRREPFPIVAFSPAGTAEGGLLYGNYGSQTDLQLLRHLGLEPASCLLLLRLGRLPVWDKISNAAAAGAAGVLLYWDPADLNEPDFVFNASLVPSVAARPPDLESGSLASLPAQTLSTAQARQLLGWLQRDPPSPWQGALASSLGGLKNNMTVRLVTYNRVKERTICNVIGNMQGFTERDHYVLVGAPRSWWGGEAGGDVLASTALLLQLAHSLAHVRQVEKWKPSRGIKLCSWGASELGHAGMLLHIQSHAHVLWDRALAYVDLGQLVLGNASMVAMTTAALHQYVNEASFRVPDPNDAAYSVHDLAPASSDMSLRQIPNLGYPGNPDNFLFLHQLGVPVLKLQHVPASRSASSIADMAGEEQQHHYRYHVGVMRVLSLALLSQVDSLLLPYSVQNYAHDIHLSVWQTSETVRDFSQDAEDMEMEESITDELVEAGNAFSEYIQTSLRNEHSQIVHMTNDAKILFERAFITRTSRGSRHVLYPASRQGVLLEVEEAALLGQLTKNWTQVHRLAHQLQRHLGQALDSLRMAN